MHLSDFIRNSIGEIVLGVAEARSITRNLSSVSPGMLQGETLNEKTNIEFEVALTTKRSEEKGSTDKATGGFEIAVMGARIGLGGETEGTAAKVENNETVSRLTFAVPIYLNARFGEPSDLHLDENQKISILREKLRS